MHEVVEVYSSSTSITSHPFQRRRRRILSSRKRRLWRWWWILIVNLRTIPKIHLSPLKLLSEALDTIRWWKAVLRLTMVSDLVICILPMMIFPSLLSLSTRSAHVGWLFSHSQHTLCFQSLCVYASESPL